MLTEMNFRALRFRVADQSGFKLLICSCIVLCWRRGMSRIGFCVLQHVLVVDGRCRCVRWRRRKPGPDAIHSGRKLAAGILRRRTSRSRSAAVRPKERFDATNFSLHGLWPMRQELLRRLRGSAGGRQGGDWQRAAGGSSCRREPRRRWPRPCPERNPVSSGMNGSRHGTCTKMSADDYFGAAIRLIDELNGFGRARSFCRRISARRSKAEPIKAAFDKSFGEGAGERVKMSCRRAGGVRVITRTDDRPVGGCGFIADGADAGLAKLIQSAGSTSFGCDQGVVDAAGF